MRAKQLSCQKNAESSQQSKMHLGLTIVHLHSVMRSKKQILWWKISSSNLFPHLWLLKKIITKQRSLFYIGRRHKKAMKWPFSSYVARTCSSRPFKNKMLLLNICDLFMLYWCLPKLLLLNTQIRWMADV